MRTSEYWEKRSLQLEESLHNKAEQYYHDLGEQYTLAARATQKDLAVLYNKLAGNNGVSMAEAKKMLTTNELKEFRWTVDEYIKYGRENAISGAWMKELENASLRYRISRLEAMKVQMQHHAEVVMAKEVDGMTRMLSDIYTEGYYKTGHMIQSGLGIGHSFAELDTNKIDKVLSRPWAPDGKNFSERIWGQHRPQLVNDLHSGLTQMIARGDSPDKLIEMISKKYNVSKKKAGNLVMTEAAYFSSKADQDSFKEMEVEEQRFVATLDSHTSQECRDMDGKVFKTSDIIIGENAPPLHCRCRSVMTPYFEGNVQGRMARNEDGNSEPIPEDIPYHEWEKKYVKGGKDAVKPDVEPEPKTLKEKVERIKPELEAKQQSLSTKKVELQNKTRDLNNVKDDIQVIDVRRTNLQNTKTKYDTWKDLNVDTGIDGMQDEVSHWQQKVDELEAKHSRYFDRPERGTAEYDEWRKWKRNVNYDELFDGLVDAKRELTTAQSQVKRMQEMKAFVDSVDIDDLTAQLDELDGALMDKRTTAATLTDDIAHLTDDIADTRLGIENTYRRAGKSLIDELDGKDFITDEVIEAAEKEMREARRAYMKADREHYDDLYAKYKDACKKYDELQNSMMQHNAALVKETLEQVRELGASDFKALNTGHLKNSRSAVAKAVKKAYEHYPREWVDISANHSGVNLKKQMRGYYSDGRLEIAISGWNDDSQFRCSMHELGHRFEHVLEGLADLESVFYNRRTDGEALQWLGGRYKKSEKSRFDDFVERYMGKYYDGKFYELVSMGFEYAYTNPAKLMKDKDMAEWIYGILTLF